MIVAAAVQAIRRNMMRSALTMLGVFIGVAALVAMVAVGKGANQAARRQIERLGTNLVVVVPGSRTMGDRRGGLGSTSTLTTGDAQAILHEATAVSQVSYVIRAAGQVRYGSQNWSTRINGVSANYPPMTNWRIQMGRAITEDDVAIAALVAVIGETVAKQLFGPSQRPIGARRLHVLLQFPAEAAFLSVTGGVAGIIMGGSPSRRSSPWWQAGRHRSRRRRSREASCSPPRWESSSAIIPPARRQASIRSRR
ncbi:MAG: ABC transporter permease [Pseudolabrys sp.]